MELKIENLFDEKDIEIFSASPNPGTVIFEYMEKYYRRLGQIDIDNNIILA